MSKEEVERKALAQLIRRERAKQAIRADLFDKQLALHDDPAQFKATHAGRRSGKSTGMAPSACLHVMDAGFNEVVIIGAETQKKAKELHWASLQQLIVKHNLPLTGNSSSGSFSTPWGAKIIFWGLNDSGAVELLRGFKLKAVYFDEVQFYSKFLKRLISTVLEPALGDTGGPCTLYGTPSVTRKGEWADICTGRVRGWSIHHWDVRQNTKYKRNPESFLQQVLSRNGWSWDPANPGDAAKTTATFAREYLGLFVNDPNSQVFRYDPARHSVEALPTARTNGFCTLGIDYGTTDDPCAWVVVWSARGSREMYIVEAREHYNLLPDDAAEVTKKLIDTWQPQRVVGDSGGLGAPYVGAFNRKYGHLSDRWVQPAEKQGHLGQIAIVSGEIDSGRVHCLPAAKALADEWEVLPWKESDLETVILPDGRTVEKAVGGRDEFQPGFNDHMSDAARYAIMSHLTDVPEKPKPVPTPKELEAAAKEARLAAARASKNEGFDI